MKQVSFRVPDEMSDRCNRFTKRTSLKMADALRLGLDRILTEFESTGMVQLGPCKPSKKKARAAK